MDELRLNPHDQLLVNALGMLLIDPHPDPANERLAHELIDEAVDGGANPKHFLVGPLIELIPMLRGQGAPGSAANIDREHARMHLRRHLARLFTWRAGAVRNTIRGVAA